MTLNTDFRVSGGDSLCILCALLSAIHIIITGLYTKIVDSLALGVIQLGFVGLLSMVLTIRGYIGAAILLFSVLIAEVNFKRSDNNELTQLID